MAMNYHIAHANPQQYCAQIRISVSIHFFQKCISSSLKGNLTPHEEAKNNPKVNAHFFNYDITDIFLSNQTKHNSAAP